MLASQRPLFSFPDGGHYLNCAYMSPLARPVEEAGVAALLRRRDPSPITPADFFTGADRARALFAELIGADDPGRVALVPAASYGIATVARNVSVSRGQNVVLVGEQFPSNVYSWRRLCAERSATVRTVGAPESEKGRGDAWNERLLEAIDRDTAVVALEHVHWADGTRFDLEAAGARAREVGAALVVDATQSMGALPFDVARIRPDAVVSASYKTMFGPHGLGVAGYGPRFDGGMPLEETWLGRAGSEDFAGLVAYRDEYQPGAARYDMGGRSSLSLMPMLIAAMELLLSWKVERVQAYCAALMADPVRRAQELGYGVEDERWRVWHLLGLRLPRGVAAERVHAAMRERRVSVSVRGSALRVAPSVYNEAADTDALLDGLRAALG